MWDEGPDIAYLRTVEEHVVEGFNTMVADRALVIVANVSRCQVAPRGNDA